MQHLKKNDDILDKLNEDDSATRLQNAVLMSRVAGHIVHAIEEGAEEGVSHGEAKKPPLRSAKSLKRDAALDKLTQVMNAGGRASPKYRIEAGVTRVVEEEAEQTP